MRINENMLKAGEPFYKCLVVLISDSLFYQDLYRTFSLLLQWLPPISQDPKDRVQFSLLSTPGSDILRMGSREGLGKPGIIVGTSPNTCHCLLCHPDAMTSYKEGREQKALFSSRYLRRLLTSTVFLGMRGAGARLWFLRSELILEVKENSTSHSWPDSAELPGAKGHGGCNGHQNPGCCPCSLEGLQNTRPCPLVFLSHQVLTNLRATWMRDKDWHVI